MRPFTRLNPGFLGQLGSQVVTVPSAATRRQQTTVCMVSSGACVPVPGSSSWLGLCPGRKAMRVVRTEALFLLRRLPVGERDRH